MSGILDDLKTQQVQALQALAAIEDDERLNQWRQDYLGKKSLVAQAFSSLGSLSKENDPRSVRLPMPSVPCWSRPWLKNAKPSKRRC